MFWFVRIFVMLALTAVVVIGLGFLLPEERTAVKTTLIDAPLSRVYQVVTDVDRQAAWRSDLKSVHVERRGELWAWTEDQNSGTTFTVEETAKEPQKRYEWKYATSNGMRGKWLGEFVALSEDRTKLTLTQTVAIENPLRRVAAFIMLNLDTLMDIYLGDLGRYASQSETTLDPLLRPAASPTPTPAATPAPTAAPAPEPSPSPSPTATVTATATTIPTAVATPTPAASPVAVTPTTIAPPVTPTPSVPAVSVPPLSSTPSNPTLPTLDPASTSSSVIIPGSTSLPPNTPSLLTPAATPSATPLPTATATGTR